jgi:hypothetical protein
MGGFAVVDPLKDGVCEVDSNLWVSKRNQGEVFAGKWVVVLTSAKRRVGKGLDSCGFGAVGAAGVGSVAIVLALCVMKLEYKGYCVAKVC